MQELLDWLKGHGWIRSNPEPRDEWGYRDWWISPDSELVLGIDPLNPKVGEHRFTLGREDEFQLVPEFLFQTDDPQQMFGYLLIHGGFLDNDWDENPWEHGDPIGPNYTQGASEFDNFEDRWN